MIDQSVIDELVLLRTRSRDAADQFSDAIKTQSELHELSRGALRRFITAKERDALADLDSEAGDLARLLEVRT